MAPVLRLNSYLNCSIELVVRRKVQERPSNWNKVSMESRSFSMASAAEANLWAQQFFDAKNADRAASSRGAQNTLFITFESASRSSLLHATAGIDLAYS
jgi:hypothetical protein